MEEMKEKHKSDPRQWPFPRLAHQFGISAIAVSKIVHSSFAPTPEQRVKRWLQREEFKSIQTQFLRSIAKQERSKLIEADLQSRYGTLYSPPPTRVDPIIERYTEQESKIENDSEDEVMRDSDDEDGDDRVDRLKDTHELELSSAGGMTSVYRRITAEAKATVEAKLESDVRFQRQFAQDVHLISKKEKEQKERDQLFQKDKGPAPRTFFTMFREDISASEEKSATSQDYKSKFLRDKPWRQKHVTSKKSTRIKHWPGTKEPNAGPLPVQVSHSESDWPHEE